jgi:5-(carboxyamino)imidazole ribonucleotide mutase
MSGEHSLIEIRTGSKTDIPKITGAYDVLDKLEIPYEPRILSAHRTPYEMLQAAENLRGRGFRVSLAAAGKSAHLPGMTASTTCLPVVGLPVMTKALRGQDSLYSIIQMPGGIPVGCVGPGQAESAAMLAARIAYQDNIGVRERIRELSGVEQLVGETDWSTRTVGIFEPQAQLPEDEIDGLLRYLGDMGLGYERYKGMGCQGPGILEALEDIELRGATAIIAMGTLDDEEATNYFPKEVARRTIIPTIGLPIATGYAGKAHHIEGDIFRNMLLNTMPEEEDRGFPVAGMAINGFVNAALYAVQIAGLYFPDVQDRVIAYRKELSKLVGHDDGMLEEHDVSVFMKQPSK